MEHIFLLTSQGMFPNWASQALGECLRLRRYNHPHVLSIFGVGVDQRRFHILYPHMAQGTLKALVAETGKVSDQVLRK